VRALSSSERLALCGRGGVALCGHRWVGSASRAMALCGHTVGRFPGEEWRFAAGEGGGEWRFLRTGGGERPLQPGVGGRCGRPL